MSRFIPGILPFLAAAFLLAAPAFAQDEPASSEESTEESGEMWGAEMTPEMQAMMAEYMKLSAKNEHHERLQKLVGDWDATTQFRMSPDQDWSPESSGTCSFESVAGDRFVLQRFEGPGMGDGAEKFEGVGLTGYDNSTSKYTSFWTDSMSTMVMKMEGDWDEASQEITQWSENKNPMSGEMETSKYVTRFIDDNTMEYEMFAPAPGGGDLFMMGKITYKRRA
jgi:hypothetical protein